MLQIFTHYLEVHKDKLREPEKIDDSVYVISHAVLGVLHTAVLEDFENYDAEILQKHLEQLVGLFLLKFDQPSENGNRNSCGADR